MKKLTNEEKAKITALPLIELNENDSDKSIILEGIKDVFAAFNMPLIDEFADDSKYHLAYSRKDGDLNYTVIATYDSAFRFITLTISFNKAPKSKRKKVSELINLLNIESPQSLITMMPGAGVSVRSGMFLTRWFNTQELYINLKGLLFNGRCYSVMAAIVITSNEKPASIIEAFFMGVQELREGKSIP